MKLSKSLFSSLTAGVILMGGATSCSENDLVDMDIVNETPSELTSDPNQESVAKNQDIYRLSTVNGKSYDNSSPIDTLGWCDCPACGLG